MKTLCKLSLIFFILSISACKKSDKESSIIGKWKLIETLADPGDGSGKWQSVKNSSSSLFLNADGTVSGKDFTHYKLYSIIDNQTIEFIYQDNRKIILFYKLKGSTLEISGGCFEPCGSRFKK